LETINHIEKLSKLYPNNFDNAEELIKQHEDLGGKLFNFIKYIEENWKT
jgi:hypothetical protein